MSKNTESEMIAGALASLSSALDAASDPHADKAVIIARVVRGFTPENWRSIRATTPAGHWQAFPVDGENAEFLCQTESDSYLDNVFPVSPFVEVRGALTRSMFLRQINSELLRIGRNGGCLSLVGASMVEKCQIRDALGESALINLEALLGEILLSMMESCDSLGIMKNGNFGCCLPGMGQLGARNFAEKAQAAFEKAAKSFFPASGASAGKTVTCAFGIVNLLQGEKGDGSDLMQRAKNTLEIALGKNNEHIHQESTFTPLEGATLVQSSEKRFLFFGGDPS